MKVCNFFYVIKDLILCNNVSLGVVKNWMFALAFISFKVQWKWQNVDHSTQVRFHSNLLNPTTGFQH